MLEQYCEKWVMNIRYSTDSVFPKQSASCSREPDVTYTPHECKSEHWSVWQMYPSRIEMPPSINFISISIKRKLWNFKGRHRIMLSMQLCMSTPRVYSVPSRMSAFNGRVHPTRALCRIIKCVRVGPAPLPSSYEQRNGSEYMMNETR